MTKSEVAARITPELRDALLAPAPKNPFKSPFKRPLKPTKKFGDGTEKAAWLINGVIVKRNTCYGYNKDAWSQHSYDEALRLFTEELAKYNVRPANHVIVGDWIVQEYIPHSLDNDVPWNLVPNDVKAMFYDMANDDNFDSFTADLGSGNMGLTSLDGNGEYVVFDW